MLGGNWSWVLRPLYRPQKNSKALRRVLKSDRFFLGVPKRLRKECVPLDLVFFLLPYSVNLFFFFSFTSLSKLVWSCEGNRWRLWLDVSCWGLWKPWLISAVVLAFSLSSHSCLSPSTGCRVWVEGNMWRILKQYKSPFSALVKQVFYGLSSNLMDTKLFSVKLICLFRSHMTLMDIQQSIFRKLKPAESTTAQLTNTKCLSKHLRSLLFIHSGVPQKRIRIGSLFLSWNPFCFVLS